MPEEPIFFAGDGFRLFGVLHRPVTAGDARGFVLCAPFAEEKKGAHRLLVDLARTLCARGVPVLRFDYRGTGDSQGAFTDFTISGAIGDIRSAIAFLRERTGVRTVGLAGARLGATLAAVAAQEDRSITHLALWEPIPNGRRYMQMNLRQKKIREMMTAAEGQEAEKRRGGEAEKQSGGEAEKRSGEVAKSVTPSPAHPVTPSQEGYDFDGYWITPALHGEMEKLVLPAPAAGKAPALVLAVSVNAAGRVSHDVESLRAAYEAAGAEAIAAGVLAEPFWSLQDPVPVPELIRATADWALPSAG